MFRVVNNNEIMDEDDSVPSRSERIAIGSALRDDSDDDDLEFDAGYGITYIFTIQNAKIQC